MSNWLNKEDFGKYVQLTVNLESRLIDPIINKTYLFDVVPVVSDAMMDAIKAVLDINPIQWSKNTTYVAGDKVFSDSIYYICVTGNTDSLPTSSNTNWAEIQLMTFWLNYVKPYFILSAYGRFLFWHGANITQFGIRQNNEDSSVEITPERKAELLAETRNEVNIFLSRLNKKFSSVNGVFDGVTYTVDCGDNTTPTRGANIWGVGALGKTKNKCCEDGYPDYL